MKKTILIAATALVIISGLTGCVKRSEKRVSSPTPGLVFELKVIPPDAAVIIDDRLVGNAWDLQLLHVVGPGPHTIEIRKEGYQTYKGKITGTTTYIEVELKKSDE